MNMNTERLNQSLARLQGEQSAIQSALNAAKAQLATVNAERLAAVRRFDTGYDEAQADVDRLSNDRDQLELAVVKLERQAAEYPERIAHVNEQIGVQRHRAGLVELLELRKAEQAALDAFSAAVYNFAYANQALQAVSGKRRILASSLELSARTYNQGAFEMGKFSPPTVAVVQNWLEAGPEYALTQLERIRAKFVEVE